MLDEGAGFAGFAAGPMGQTPAVARRRRHPRPASYTKVPFKPGLARFACNVTVEGEPWPYCPRTILRNADRARAELGYRLKMGIELEFFLVKEDDGRIVLLDDLDTLDQPCYDMKGLTRNYEFISTLSNYQNELGWGNYANDHEDANGQFESNFEYDDALVTADRAIFFRYMVHAMAQERGHLATFMPKPFSNLTGNGGTSTSRCGTRPARRNLFEDDDDPRGLGLSELAYQFLGGVIDHAEAVLAVGRADGELVQADRRRRADLGRHLVAGVRHVRHEQPHAGDPHPRAGPHRDPRDRRLREPVPGGGGAARRRPRRHRAGLDPGEPNTENLYDALAPRTSSSAASSRSRHAARRGAST